MSSPCSRRKRRDDIHDIRQDRARDWRGYRAYDHDRFEPGQRTCYANRYYRDGSCFPPRALGRDDRIYRDGTGNYYGRRTDGTTVLIVGGVIANGRSSLLGALVGAGGGALLGRSIDRSNVRWR